MKKTICTVFLLLTVALITDSSAQSTLKAIVGGTLINPDGANPIENAVIIVEDNRIKQVGASENIIIPEFAERIDVVGKWIIPGLIDAHVHFFQSGGLYTRPDIVDLRKHVPYSEGELAQIRGRLPDTFARFTMSASRTAFTSS